tara:strand:+ start:315 stop:1118 length:804 start_codon:yes stop_codon:yes gene_type:complete
MPRITYADRFETVLRKDYISKRDREFLESLYAYYKSNRVLTSGRKYHFLRLENHYRHPPVVTADDKELLEELNTLISRLNVIDDEGGQAILASFSDQVRSGNALSLRQMEIVEDKRDLCTAKNIQQARQWKDTWNSDKAEKFNICVNYYDKAGYFGNIVIKAKTTPEYVPSFGEYKKLTENKYAKKILTGWYGTAKYQLGDMVRGSAAAPWTARDLTLGTILKVNITVPTSPSKGNKKYLVMDLLTTRQYELEERHLKRTKKLKKKK